MTWPLNGSEAGGDLALVPTSLFISLKISKTIGIISRLRYVLPTSILLHIYRSLIHPYISYPSFGMGPNFKIKSGENLNPPKKSLTLNLFPQ